jgi:hypothetical protein
MSGPTLKPCPFCGSQPACETLPYGLPVVRCANPNCDVHSGALTSVEWQTRPVEDALRARAEAAEAALAQARAEGEAAGAAHERAAVVAMLLQSPDPVWAEVARCIMDGEHVAPAAGGAR